MYVIVTGLRGIPEIQGGIETHAENLYPHLVKLGCDIEIITRPAFYKNRATKNWKGIKIRYIWSPRTPAIEAIVHTFLAVIYASFKRPDVLHIHAVGPMLMAPLARMFGIRVVVTHHGPDYDREKWGFFAKWVLRLGEKFGVKYSNEVIVISNVIKNIVKNKHEKCSSVIPNGVNIPILLESKNVLDEFGLIRNKYILQVSRFVPEKRQLDLINAFNVAKLHNWKLVLTGDVTSPDKFTENIKSLASDNKNIILTGFQGGLNLQELYTHAGLFVLPSSHEGMPIAILEALSYGLKVLASDIPANLELGLPDEQYFSLGDVDSLAKLLQEVVQQNISNEYRDNLRAWIKDKYNWHFIASKTIQIYEKAIN